MSSTSKPRRLLAVGLAALSLSASMASEADAARRGGSFGSRGMRTYSPSRSPYGGGPFGAPINRSITPRTGNSFNPSQRPFGGPQTQRPGGGFLQRWGGPLLGGLAVGGLLGMMMGHGFGGGFGGGAGMLGGLLQFALIGLAVWFVVRLFRRRREATVSGYDAPQGTSSFNGFGQPQQQPPPSGFGAPGGLGQDDGRPSMFSGLGGFGQNQSQAQPQGWGGQGGNGNGDELGLGQGEVAGLERTFIEVQEAYGREDYGAIRERCTPEVMSFMSEELGRNATEGRKNEMRDFHVLHRELTESWREETGDYATLAIRFSALDWWVDRRTNEVVEGSPVDPTNSTEFWTFVRPPGAFGGGGWKVSAIQEEGR